MQKKFVYLMLLCCLFGCKPQAKPSQSRPQPPAEKAAVPVFSDSAFSIVILPDTQFYTIEGSTYSKQMQWIIKNRSALNIRFVVHTGDITHHNIASEWQVASAAHAMLDKEGIPYSVTTGNHEYYPANQVGLRNSKFREYFGAARFKGKPWYGGAFDASNENNYCLFESGALRFLILSLEYLPRKEVIAWANKVAEEHPDRRVIVVTHSYLDGNAEYMAGESVFYSLPGNEGNELWKRLISRHKNIFMVLCGHMAGSAVRTRTGDHRNTVFEILTDFQADGGGNGWLKVLRFNPPNNTITVNSLSVTGMPLGTAVYYKSLNSTLTYNMADEVSRLKTGRSRLGADCTNSSALFACMEATVSTLPSEWQPAAYLHKQQTRVAAAQPNNEWTIFY